MGILALAADERVADVEFAEDELRVRLRDGRTISAPLVWYPRLLNATELQRSKWQIVGGGYGIHWDDVDEDLSTEGLLRGGPAPHHTKSIAISDQSVAAIEGSGDSQKGFLDYFTEAESAATKLTRVIELLSTEILGFSEKINRHVANLDKLKRKKSRAADYRKGALLTASHMNTLSKRITKVLPEFEERVQVLEQSYSSYVSFAKPESDRDVEQISSLRTALRNLLEKIDPAKKGVMTFRESALSLKEQNISEHLSKAAVSQAHSLHLLVANMEDIESFALRINFQIDEKFKGRDERS
jgi:hypothetical protein